MEITNIEKEMREGNITRSLIEASVQVWPLHFSAGVESFVSGPFLYRRPGPARNVPGLRTGDHSRKSRSPGVRIDWRFD